MLYFRSCPHCEMGTVQLDSDEAGKYFQCLNCGWMLDLKEPQLAASSATVAAVHAEETSPAPVASSRAA